MQIEARVPPAAHFAGGEMVREKDHGKVLSLMCSRASIMVLAIEFNVLRLRFQDARTDV